MIIKRYGPPGKLDHAPKDTICEVIQDHKVKERYIQKDDDEDDPIWELLEKETA